MNSYIGITIGPIYETIGLVSKVAGMWASSFMFSDCAKRICEKLIQYGVNDNQFLAPYFEVNNSKIKSKCIEQYDLYKMGIGLFHDQIILKYDNLEVVCKAIEDVKEDIANDISKDLEDEDVRDIVRNYFQIYACKKEIVDTEVNPLIVMSKYLAAMELQKKFQSIEKNNPFINLFENQKLKNSYLLKDTKKESQIIDDYGNVQDIQKIVEVQDKSLKINHYYAMIQTDGDSMGKVLQTLKTPKEIKEFSKKCFDFGAQASVLIHEYGGIVIYAGGDDLLYIAPLMSKDGQKHVLTLVQEISNTFNEIFKYEIKHLDETKPSISGGMLIRYYKFPLYEAFQESYQLMYQSKQERNNQSNFIINLRKHSGQSLKFSMHEYEKHPLMNCITNILEVYTADSLHSLTMKLQNYRALFQDTMRENEINILLDNIFSDLHFNQQKVLVIKEMYHIIKVELKDVSCSCLDMLICVLRYTRFYMEKKGDK